MLTQRFLRFLAASSGLFGIALAASAQAPSDVRGLTFTNYTIGDYKIGGVIGGSPADVDYGLIGLDPIAHTFDIAADPLAPGDPSRIVLETRLPFLNPDNSTAIPLTLSGTYNAQTGAFQVSGAQSGSFWYDLGFDTTHGGAFPTPLEAWADLTDPTLTLSGNAFLDGNGSPIIIGTNPIAPDGGPGDLSFAAATEAFVPIGDDDPAHDAVLKVSVDHPYGSIADFFATGAVPTAAPVPELSTAATFPLGLGFLGVLLVMRRKKIRTG